MSSSLLVRAANRVCALPLAQVSETMRELECIPCSDVPNWILGATVIRGVAVPVVDLGTLLGGTRSAERGRMVTVRTNPGAVALRVDEVVGVRVLPERDVARRTPLLEGAERGRREEIATLDGDLVSILDASEILGDELHARVASEGVG